MVFPYSLQKQPGCTNLSGAAVTCSAVLAIWTSSVKYRWRVIIIGEHPKEGCEDREGSGGQEM